MLTFSSIDLLNSNITRAGATCYRTKTSVSFRGRKTTSLVVMTSSGPELEYVVGGIDWREKSLVVQGRSWDVADLKSKLVGHSNTTRIWQWAGEKYQINLYGRQWVVVSTQHLVPLVTLHQSVPRIFKSSRPATIHFHTQLSDTDMIFFILMTIYSEVGWRDEQVDGHLSDDIVE